MAWTSPMTFTANTTLTAAQLNTYLRDNMNETAAAKATATGNIFVATGANAIAERTITGGSVAVSESTASTSYTDLATVGPTVTATTGTKALVFWHAFFSNSLIDTATWCSVEVTGASSSSASDVRALMVDGVAAGNACEASMFELYDGLTPGSNTFTMKYRVTGGTGTWNWRRIAVVAL